MRAAALTAALGCLLPAQGAAADFSKCHSYQGLTAELKAIVTANATIARIASIGRTREGRDIWAVELANQAGTPVDQRPGLLVAANFEGDHVIGSELALFMVDALTKGYATDASIKQRLDTGVIYVVPRVNADGAELMFAPVKALRRMNATPFDADNDGRVDEDGPEDLNKDGVITLMRVKDPKGPWVMPGVYTVRLTAAGVTQSQPLVVKMDPRVKTPRQGLEQQFTLSMRLYDAMATVHDEIARLERSEGGAARLPGDPAEAPRPSTEWRRLYELLLGVYGTLQEADVEPTAAVVAAAERLLRQIDSRR
jgi:hypothetical protein